MPHAKLHDERATAFASAMSDLSHAAHVVANVERLNRLYALGIEINLPALLRTLRLAGEQLAQAYHKEKSI